MPSVGSSGFDSQHLQKIPALGRWRQEELNCTVTLRCILQMSQQLLFTNSAGLSSGPVTTWWKERAAFLGLPFDLHIGTVVSK